MNVADICIDVDDDIPGKNVQRLPEILALSAKISQLGKDIGSEIDPGPVFLGYLTGPISGS